MENHLHPAIRNQQAVLFDVGGTLVHPDWPRLGQLVQIETGMLFTAAQMYKAFYAMLQAINAELKAGINSRREREAHWVFVETFRALGIDEAKFVRTPELEKQAESLRQKYGSPLILAVGRLVYYKGFEYLIEAMNQIPSANLVIVGQGILRPSLERLIDSMGLQERVHIVDPVDDLRPYYYACDVFVLPSCEASEVFGIVQIEAMACGKPVINTALPTGVPEVSVDWRTGRTVPPKNPSALANALHDVLDNQERYDRFCRNALHEVSARFTKVQFFAALDRLIERAINSAGSALESRSADLNTDSIV